MTQGGIGFDRGEQGDQKRQLRCGFTTAHGDPFDKGGGFADMSEDLFHAEAVRHRRCLLLAQVQAGVALLAVTLLPPDASGLNGQRVVRAVGHAVPAVVAAADRPRVVAGFAAQVAALQEQRQAAARPVHAGKRNDLTN